MNLFDIKIVSTCFIMTLNVLTVRDENHKRSIFPILPVNVSRYYLMYHLCLQCTHGVSITSQSSQWIPHLYTSEILKHILHFRRSAFYKNVLMRSVNQFNLSIPTAVHLHKSMYSVVPPYNTLTKVSTKSWVSTSSIWNQSQTIFYCVKKSCSSLKWKMKIVHPLNSDWIDRSDWLADNNNLTSRASSSPTFW